MGVYVNPSHGDKARWLADHGAKLCVGEDFRLPEVYAEVRRTHMPFYLVDNGVFLALGLMYSYAEALAMIAPDPRPRLFGVVPLQALRDDSGLSDAALQSLQIPPGLALAPSAGFRVGYL